MGLRNGYLNNILCLSQMLDDAIILVMENLEGNYPYISNILFTLPISGKQGKNYKVHPD